MRHSLKMFKFKIFKKCHKVIAVSFVFMYRKETVENVLASLCSVFLDSLG
jgi:hypothetical protein